MKLHEKHGKRASCTGLTRPFVPGGSEEDRDGRQRELTHFHCPDAAEAVRDHVANARGEPCLLVQLEQVEATAQHHDDGV